MWKWFGIGVALMWLGAMADNHGYTLVGGVLQIGFLVFMWMGYRAWHKQKKRQKPVEKGANQTPPDLETQD